VAEKEPSKSKSERIVLICIIVDVLVILEKPQGQVHLTKVKRENARESKRLRKISVRHEVELDERIFLCAPPFERSERVRKEKNDLS